MTTRPPWTLNVPVVTITRPQPPAIGVTLPPRVAITVPWPPLRVVQPRRPPALGVIWLHAPPQGPWRSSFPQGHPLRTGWSPPPRAPRPPG